MVKVGFVLGTRPEIIKLFSCIKYCSDHGVEHFVVNTDQHYDENMRDVFFRELGLNAPEYNLGVGSGSHAKMLASMLEPLEETFEKEAPDVVVVQGDTNTVLAGAIVAAKMGIKVAHVEAGLRSYDKSMPEEYNRILTDHCSDYLFAPTEKQKDILLKEGIPEACVTVTGNTVVDAIYAMVDTPAEPQSTQKYVLLTCHRPSNTDDDARMEAILSAVQKVCEQEDFACHFPVHPRLKSKLPFIQSFDRIITSEPLGYRDLIHMQKEAEMIFTDSGGIQEESCILQKKCVILRTNTERPETVEVGGAILLDAIEENEIVNKYQMLRARQVQWTNPFGDGKAAERIIKKLVENEN